MRSGFYLLLLCALIFFFEFCKKEAPVISKTLPPEVIQEFPIVYKASLPEGKLPFPQHNPEIDTAEMERLIDDLFIINNFGLYQCGDSPEDCYFHDGLDIILPNETPIFAVEAGTVRANIGGDQYYRTLVIEDEDEPGFAWTYTHVYYFAEGIIPGVEVSQGQYLARVNFKGLEHIHLSRARLRAGGSWNNFSDLVNIFPEDYFVLRDEDAPVFKSPLHYFKNSSNDIFEHGVVDTIFGEVDIVASIRDISTYSGDWIDGGDYWGDRLCIKKIDYRILKDGVVIDDRSTFDFAKLAFRFNENRAFEVQVVFKHHLIFKPDFEPSDNNGFYSHYILTNARPDLEGEINPVDERLAWNTQVIDTSGQLRYPNGLYQVEVTAYDNAGNHKTLLDSVYVKN